MKPVDINYIYGRLENQKMTGPIRPGDTDEAYYQCGWNNALCRVDMILAKTPTLDVEPVRHGYWIEGLDGSCMCSECGKVSRYEIGYYCSNCGAKMDLPSQ